MAFKHARLAEIWLNGQDVSAYFMSMDFAAKVDTAPTSTFKSTWKSFLPGNSVAQLTAQGYYDPTTSTVRTTLQAASGVATIFPAGALAIGDLGRLISIVSSDYQETAKITDAVGFNWSLNSTSVMGYGVCLHVLASENPGTITGTGDGVMTSASNTTGAIATLHVTAYTSGTHSFKLQDATTQGGAYSDIAGGAFTNVTATGAQRLVISGTIRQFVRAVATINTTACTYGIAVART